MSVVSHHPDCAVRRSGELRAWCDCGAEAPVLEEIRRKVWHKIGAGFERGRLHRLLDDVLKTGVSAEAAEIINAELDAWIGDESYD